MKKCSKCGVEKDRSEFHVCQTNRDGLRGKCRCCIKKSDRTRREKLEFNPPKLPEYKRCASCEVTKGSMQFYKNITNFDGLGNYCKRCVSQQGETRREKLRASRPEKPKFKKCSSCDVMKASQQFNSNPVSLDGLCGICKSCIKNKRRLRKYGLTSEEYKEMLSYQQGKCAICGSTSSKTNLHEAFCVDHDHKTGKVRGLLCVKCNAGLGYFEDKPESLRKSIEYLRDHQNAKIITVPPSPFPSVGILEASDCTP